MEQEWDALPSIQIQTKFKKQVYDACESMNLQYSTLITRLLQQWLAGKIILEEEEQLFVEDCIAAIESPQGKKALKKFAEHYNSNREYPDAVEI